MTRSDCLKEFARYASLNVLGMIGLSCYILADTFFIARGLGTDGLAALNLAIPVYSFLHGTGLMVGMGGGIKYSIQRIQGKPDDANRTFLAAVRLAMGFAVFFFLMGGFFSHAIVSLFGAEGTVYALSGRYLKTILLFAPAFLMNNVLLCFVRNDGAPQLSMAAMLGGSFSNILLDWVFIFPCGLGMFGAAFATGLAPIISMAILSLHFIRGRNGFHLRYGSYAAGGSRERHGLPPAGRSQGNRRPHIRLPRAEAGRAAKILANGVPSLVAEVASGIVMIVFNSIILRLEGNVGVAAYGVIANLSLVITAVFTGIGQGSQPVISRSCGCGRPEEGRFVLGCALASMAVLSAALYAGIFFGASQITSLFNREQNALLQQIATEGLRLYFIACPFAGFNIILAVYFTSADIPGPAQAISLLRGFFVMIPMAFLLAAMAGIRGVWCAFPATEAMVALTAACLYRSHAGTRRTDPRQ